MAKGNAKATAASSNKKAVVASQNTDELPEPFAKAPARLEPFLSLLDKSSVYITHIDTLPWAFKRQIFIVPVLLNLSIAALVAWRIYAALPTYLKYVAMSIGQGGDAMINTKATPWLSLIWIVIKRTSMVAFDYLFLRYIGSWPITFFFEMPANPVSWRFSVGFQDNEIIVRESRKWGAKDLLEGIKKGQDSAFFRNRILPNIDRKYMQGKTGYLMMGKDFDLDFYSMTKAHALVKKGTLSFDDFRKTVFVHHRLHGWCSWDVHKLDDSGEEESRKKIVAFKDKLTAMGKESLFFRWLEVLQYESTQPGGFTPQRQVDAVAKVKALFERENVDFEKLVTEIGGFEGMPGFEDKS